MIHAEKGTDANMHKK